MSPMQYGYVRAIRENLRKQERREGVLFKGESLVLWSHNLRNLFMGAWGLWTSVLECVCVCVCGGGGVELKSVKYVHTFIVS